jgi:hypothetical protein
MKSRSKSLCRTQKGKKETEREKERKKREKEYCARDRTPGATRHPASDRVCTVYPVQVAGGKYGVIHQNI